MATNPRQRPVNVKDEVVRRRGYRNVRLVGEQVAEFNYRPGACARDYRVVVLRRQLVWERQGEVIEEETRYLFYITNQWTWTCAEVVSFANDRCNQENLVEQLKNGVRALRAPVNTLEANGAYMVIAALAWDRKAWLALVQPRSVRRQQLLTMEFRKFLAEVVLLPCQIVRTGRRLIYRLLQWNPWVDVLCRVSELLRKLRLTGAGGHEVEVRMPRPALATNPGRKHTHVQGNSMSSTAAHTADLLIVRTGRTDSASPWPLGETLVLGLG